MNLAYNGQNGTCPSCLAAAYYWRTWIRWLGVSDRLLSSCSSPITQFTVTLSQTAAAQRWYRLILRPRAFNQLIIMSCFGHLLISSLRFPIGFLETHHRGRGISLSKAKWIIRPVVFQLREINEFWHLIHNVIFVDYQLIWLCMISENFTQFLDSITKNVTESVIFATFGQTELRASNFYFMPLWRNILFITKIIFVGSYKFFYSFRLKHMTIK